MMYSNGMKRELSGKYIEAKYTPIFPSSSEREFAREADFLMQSFAAAVVKNIDFVSNVNFNVSRSDANEKPLTRIFRNILRDTWDGVDEKRFRRKVEKVADGVRRSALREWRTMYKKTFGKDIATQHYKKEFYKEVLDQWCDDSYQYVENMMKSTLEQMQRKIKDDRKEKKSNEDIAADVIKILMRSKGNTERAFKDMVAKLNTEIMMLHCKDIGADRYTWITKRDERVRPCHRALHRRRFYWDKPPEMWHIGPGGNIVYEGRYCHPGQDYNCRCIARPIFDKKKAAKFLKDGKKNE